MYIRLQLYLQHILFFFLYRVVPTYELNVQAMSNKSIPFLFYPPSSPTPESVGALHMMSIVFLHSSLVFCLDQIESLSMKPVFFNVFLPNAFSVFPLYPFPCRKVFSNLEDLYLYSLSLLFLAVVFRTSWAQLPL